MRKVEGPKSPSRGMMLRRQFWVYWAEEEPCVRRTIRLKGSAYSRHYSVQIARSVVRTLQKKPL